MHQFRIGEFARRAGVTIRTLRYYDKRGLLKPSAWSESGQRLYTELDYARLQQIMTLKLIGLSLDEIRSLLTSDITQIEQLLDRQRKVLEEKMRRFEAVVQTIQKAQSAIHLARAIDLEQFINIIQAVHMHDQTDWLSEICTDEQKEKLTRLQSGWTLADQRRVGEAGSRLFADIHQNMSKDIHDPLVQALVERWDEFIAHFAQGDPDLAAKMNQAYLSIGDATTKADEWMRELQQAAGFIQRAKAAH
jgi:DNA-binding transcriptional MerR regulator